MNDLRRYIDAVQTLIEARTVSEGRDAALYHATGLSTAVKIIEENQLSGYDGPISLTRSRRFAQFWNESQGGGVVFVLDQSRLSQTFPIKPGALGGRPRRHEAEETVDRLRPIKPLDRYLLAIEITPKDFERIQHNVRYDHLVKHPLLKTVTPNTKTVPWSP